VDPLHSAIFAAIRDAAEGGRALSFDALLGEVADGAVKRLASDLYIFGTEVLRAASVQAGLGGEGRSVAEEVLVSWNDLEALARREKYRSDASTGARWEGSEESESPETESHRSEAQPTATKETRSASVPTDRLADEATAVDSNNQELNSAVERLKLLRKRGHDATAASKFFRRGATGPEADPGRSSNP
jgi:hypothetical protein